MVAICCCQCDPRQATYVIAVISFLHFGVETGIIISLDEEHRLVAEEDGIKYFTVLISHFYLMVASAILFLAVYKMNISLIFPWLVGSTFILFLYLAVLVLIIIRILNDWKFVELERAFVTGFTMGFVIYSMWIVIEFMWELKGDTYAGGEDWENTKVKSLFTLGMDDDDSENDEEPLFPQKSKSRTTRKQRKEDKMPLLNHP